MAPKKPGQWWDRSWTLVGGCQWSKADGPMPRECDHCWARSMARRFRPEVLDGVTLLRDRLGIPMAHRRPTLYACQISYGDLFQASVPPSFVQAALVTASQAARLHGHKFVFLTKRPPRAVDLLREWEVMRVTYSEGATGALPSSILIVASAGCQTTADAACEAFAALPRGTRWGLHLEPLIDAVDLRWALGDSYGGQRPSWVAVGAENGPGARAMDLDWARTVRDQCVAAGVPFWLKGIGMDRGRLLDGVEHNGLPSRVEHDAHD